MEGRDYERARIPMERHEGAKQTATTAGGGGGGAKARGSVVQSADPLRAMACDLEQTPARGGAIHDLRASVQDEGRGQAGATADQLPPKRRPIGPRRGFREHACAEAAQTGDAGLTGRTCITPSISYVWGMSGATAMRGTRS